jgi:hypothetical protein
MFKETYGNEVIERATDFASTKCLKIQRCLAMKDDAVIPLSASLIKCQKRLYFVHLDI